MAPTKKGNGDLYHPLRQIWKDANPLKSLKRSNDEFLEFWQNHKNDRGALQSKFDILKLMKQSRANPILQSFVRGHDKARQPEQLSGSQPPLSSQSSKVQETSSLPNESVQSSESSNQQPATIEDEMERQSKPSVSRPAPAQEKSRSKISELSGMIAKLQPAADAGLLSLDQRRELKQMKLDLANERTKLKRLERSAKATKRFYSRRKTILKKLSDSNPDVLKLQLDPGRPSLDRDQPELQDTILELVTSHCSTHEKRQMELLRNMMTLDDLLKALKEKGFEISRSGLYLRFMPYNCKTIEGKRHSHAVPVKFARPINTLRKPHLDAHFAAAGILYLKDLAGVFGNESVFVLSQDDKARVPLGLPAATKQGPIMMRMDYRVSLPDHDWVVASKHKLIPSVYAGLDIKEGNLSYSGPTYIAIRSGKHDSSTAFSHARDVERILSLENFKRFSGGKSPKPIWIIFVDGGPDENPRFPKTLQFAAQHFKSNNLDALFIATHAPHQSAYNQVERRMAPLSRDLCGLILPHDSFGNHLDSAGRTADKDLEMKNFKKAGEVLANIWSQRVIDGFDVVAEYIPPNGGTGSDSATDSAIEGYIIDGKEPDFLTERWKCFHVRQSQYMLQIVKCGDSDCCRPMQTNLKTFLHGQFLPTPVPFTTSKCGVEMSSDESNGSFTNLCYRLCFRSLVPPRTPFDAFCPSVKDKIKERICGICQLYFVTKTALAKHQKLHAVDRQLAEIVQDEEIQEQGDTGNESENIHRILDMTLWMQCPFEEIV